MSWERMGSQSVKCPCGNGTITRIDYGDDWNRYKEDIEVNCKDCNSKYTLISQSYYKHSADRGTAYYLLEKNYPQYHGIRVRDVFPETTNITRQSFEQYLIRSYRLEELKDAYEELNRVTSVSRLNGVAASIARDHKGAYRSAKIRMLREYVELACETYDSFLDNKDKRIPIEEQEKRELGEYEETKRKHMIYIRL